MPNVSVAGSEHIARLSAGETILAGLFRCGYATRVGCRRGGCGICKVDLIDGHVDYERPVAENVLTTQERSRGVCLPCRAVPRGDITIALRDENLKAVSSLLRYMNNATPVASSSPKEN